MLKETYKPRKDFVLVEVTIFRPKEEKAVFTNDSEDIIKTDDVTAYKVLAASKYSDLKVGGYVLLLADIQSPGQYGNLIPESTIIAEVEYEGLEKYEIKSYAELVEEYGQTK